MREVYKGITAHEDYIHYGPSTATPGELVSTMLPFDTPDNLVVTPTMNRWQDKDGGPGHLTNLIYSVQGALDREGLSKDTWMILGDASNRPGTDAARLASLQGLSEMNPSRLFLLTPETQAQTTEIIVQRTGINREIVEAVLLMTGYASQRAKLDIVSGGLALTADRSLRVLTLDDDTIIPERYGVLKEGVLPPGTKRKPNSQVLLDDRDPLTEDMFYVHENRISPFFVPLGKTIGEIKQEHPSIRATNMFRDTMHEELEKATHGEPAQFVVTHADVDKDDLPDPDNTQVIAITATKHGVPDYRTVRIAQAHLETEFPEEELPISSYPSGPNQLFAFRSAGTNVDSACIARQIDERTAFWPWWFVSYDELSRANPLQTVTGHYRADNELLPVWLKVLYEKTGEQYAYLSGIDTQVYHNRARTGYRPDLHEQATASLVGNIAALEASRRLFFDTQSGRIRMARVDQDYTAPREHTQRVYDEMHNLALICTRKLDSLSDRKKRQNTPEGLQETTEKMDRYLEIYGSIQKKLGNFNFETFYYHLSREVREQLNFFAEVLDATPAVIIEVQELIRKGQYPVVEYVPGQTQEKKHPGSSSAITIFQRQTSNSSASQEE